jgi:hypothetical protein
MVCVVQDGSMLGYRLHSRLICLRTKKRTILEYSLNSRAMYGVTKSRRMLEFCLSLRVMKCSARNRNKQICRSKGGHHIPPHPPSNLSPEEQELEGYKELEELTGMRPPP